MDEDEPDRRKSIPLDLLTRLLHEFFEKDGTRITKDANAAVGKYLDTFVREAVARAVAERDGGFLEVSWWCGDECEPVALRDSSNTGFAREIFF